VVNLVGNLPEFIAYKEANSWWIKHV
jgi:hypothetical protein